MYLGMFLKESKKLKKLFTANNRSLESNDYLQSSGRYDFAIGITFNLLIISAFVNEWSPAKYRKEYPIPCPKSNN